MRQSRFLTSITPLLLRYPRWLALFAGVSTTAAFAPFGIWPFALLGISLLFYLWRRSSASRFQVGYIYGLGLMGSGVSWLHVSIAQFGDLGWLFPLVITIGFVALVALYYGLLGWLIARIELSDGVAMLLQFPALWVLFEWLRGWFLTGFPWLQLGYSQIDSPLSGYAPLLGTLGASLALVISAGAINLFFMRPGRRWLSLLILAVIWAMGWLLSLQDWSRPSGEPLSVALVQGNIPQAEKWAPEQLAPSLILYAKETQKHYDKDLIIWPETAVSAFEFQVDEAFLQSLEAEIKSQQTHLVYGVVQMDEAKKRYFNAMVAMGNEQRDSYFKRHLVPFTEYLPLKALFSPVVKLFTIPMSDFTAGSGKPLMQVGPHLAGLSICYEDAFGNEMTEALPEAAYLINASNDAWFGKSLAPHQHLQIARMRALETGRYLLRATNTGISAIVGPKGELLGISPLLELDVLTGEILPMTGVTPYAASGNLPLLVLLALMLIAAIPCGHLRRR